MDLWSNLRWNVEFISLYDMSTVVNRTMSICCKLLLCCEHLLAAELLMLSICCKQVLGCNACVSTLLNTHDTCPHCRSNGTQEKIFSFTAFDNVLGLMWTFPTNVLMNWWEHISHENFVEMKQVQRLLSSCFFPHVLLQFYWALFVIYIPIFTTTYYEVNFIGNKKVVFVLLKKYLKLKN